MSVESKNIGECPDCGGEVRFKKTPYVGQEITCRNCNTYLEVVNRFPLQLDWAEMAWDEEEDEVESSHSNRRRK